VTATVTTPPAPEPGPGPGPAESPRERDTAAAVRDLLAGTGRHAVVIGLSKDPNAKLTVMLLSRRGAASLVAKIGTTPQADVAVTREHDRLVALRPRLRTEIRATVPEPLDLLEVAGRRALVTTALTGTPLSSTYQRRRHTARPAAVAADFRAVDTWLRRFQDRPAGPAHPPPVISGRAFVVRFASSPLLDVLVPVVADATRHLGGTACGARPVHGDLWAGNVLLGGPGVTGVVDWEAAELDGHPLRDVVRFALTYALYLDRRTAPGRSVSGHPDLRAGRWGAGVRYAVDGAGWFPRLFRRFVASGLERLGLAPARWREAVVWGLVDIACSADHDDFAHRHLQLAADIVTAGPRSRTGQR
jgi:aminoglycoside phosphotransferase (APT) family kinase protein